MTAFMQHSSVCQSVSFASPFAACNGNQQGSSLTQKQQWQCFSIRLVILVMMNESSSSPGGSRREGATRNPGKLVNINRPHIKKLLNKTDCLQNPASGFLTKKCLLSFCETFQCCSIKLQLSVC